MNTNPEDIIAARGWLIAHPRAHNPNPFIDPEAWFTSCSSAHIVRMMDKYYDKPAPNARGYEAFVYHEFVRKNSHDVQV